MSTQIHSQSIVNPRAQLGMNVSIGPFSIVEDGVVIGDNCQIGANALIATGTSIGKDCRIHHGAVVGHEPQDLKYAGEPTTCEIGPRTVIREYATIHRGTGESGKTVIGADVLLMGYVHIAHDCILGDHVILSNAAMLAGHCEIGDYAVIGGITPVHQFVRIGEHSMIGGGLRVPKDVPPFILAGHEPLIFQGLNSIGLRRRGFKAETIAALDKAYGILYKSNLNVSQAVARILEAEELATVAEVQRVIEFTKNSSRGILSGPRFLK
ncbi:MAG: acyl-ACP--UDP-N-acetylglucosamine O-acyltransferase [Ignavibacteria bacterium]|nr:acyl-ACP--UDP-N-acetylglucosamine O-acyltransferase [Ignavibacteria bacterium]